MVADEPDALPDLPSWAVMTPSRRAHVARVAALVGEWARALRVPPAEAARWRRAAVLHDALRDAPLYDLRALVPGCEWPRALLHGPAAAAKAAAEGETDVGVLDAVAFHTVGCSEWDHVGRVLYCADYLEPGREHDGARRRELAEAFPASPEQVLREVAAQRVAWVVQSGWPLIPETVAWWNSLVAAR